MRWARADLQYSLQLAEYFAISGTTSAPSTGSKMRFASGSCITLTLKARPAAVTRKVCVQSVGARRAHPRRARERAAHLQQHDLNAAILRQWLRSPEPITRSGPRVQ